MKIKGISLKNIRSYVDAEITFPPGAVLLEGDIGAGKTTLLMAIEFALLGSGDVDLSSLLRVGEDNGSVELTFEHNSKIYTIKRKLKRSGNSVSQVNRCELYIESEKGTQHEILSPQELKFRLLSELGLRENVNRSKSSVFRYSVYTPQEEMKKILYEDPKDRKETIRRIFGVDKYAVISNTASEIRRGVSKDIKYLEEEIKERSDLEREFSNIKENKKNAITDIEKLEKEISNLNLKEKEAELILTSQTSALGQLQERRKHIESLNREISEIQKRIERNKEYLKQKEDELNNLKKQVPKDYLSPENIDKMIIESEKIFMEIRDRKMEIEKELYNYRSLISRGVCPTCGRPIHGEEFKSKIEALEIQHKEILTKLSEADEKLKKLKKQQDESRGNEKILIRIAEKEKSILETKSQIDESVQHLESLRKVLSELSFDDEEFSKAEISVKQAREKREEIKISKEKAIGKLEALKASLKNLEERETEILEKLENIKNKEIKLDKLRKAHTILEFLENIVPSMEASVLSAINSKISTLISAWFSRLVPDQSKEVQIDPSFAPIIKQSGYEMSVNALSGGERSALALAYRLALSSVLSSNSTAPGLLILDEPTDGFSKEQLQRFGDVLRDLSFEQIIMVSHETELENVADNIIRIVKSGDVSTLY